MTTAERIVGAARDQLLARGVQHFSLRELAQELGMTAPALYRYFGSRDDLLVAVVERSFGLLDRYLFHSLQGRTPDDRLARMADGYLSFGLEHPRDFAVVTLLPGAFGMDELHEAIRRREAATFRLWVDRVRDAVDAGVLRNEGAPEETAALLWATAHGLVSLYLRGGLPVADAAGLRALFWRVGVRLMEGVAGPHWSRDALPDVVRPEDGRS